VGISCTDFLFSTSVEECKKDEKVSFKPLRKVWLSLHPFSQKLEVLKTVFLSSPVTSFTQIGQETWKI
jgi:hypothetical protein